MFSKISPVVVFTLALALGIFLGNAFGMAAGLLGLLIPVLAVIYFLGRRASTGWFSSSFGLGCILAMVGIGATLTVAQKKLPANHISHMIGKRMLLKGVVSEGTKERKASYLAIMECEGEWAGKIMLRGPKVLGELPHHSRIEAEVWVQYLPKNNPGYANYLERQGILAIGQVANWCILDTVRGLDYHLAEVRNEMTATLHRNMVDPEMAGLATAMFIGDRSGLSEDIREDFSSTGLSHILSISGMHVTIFYLFLNYLLGFMGKRLWSNYLRTGIILIVLFAYMGLTGFSPAVCRAVFMLSMLKLSETFFLEKNTLNILALTALILLLIQPLLLFDLGFQLSYLAVGGLILLSPRVEAIFEERIPYLPKLIRNSIAVTIGAQLTTTPVILYHFGTFPTYFILANLILLPIVTLATNVGIAALLFGWIPGVGSLLGGILDTSLWLVSKGSALFSQLPGAVITQASLKDTGFCILLSMLLPLVVMVFFPELRAMAQFVVRISGRNFRTRAATLNS